MSDNPIAACLELPPARPKPRRTGMNLCLDDGVGVAATADALAVVGEFLDVIRVGRAGAAIFPPEWLREKAEVCAKHDVVLEIGGPLYEVAFIQGKTDQYFDAVKEMGVSALEVSVNLIEPPEEQLLGHISDAAAKGIEVFFEYGRKYPDDVKFDVDDAVAGCRRAIDAGAKFVQIERAEIDILIESEPEALLELAERLGHEVLTFEAGPRKPDLAGRLLRLMGPDVNLASLVLSPENAVDGVYLVENARRGMERFVGYEFIAKGAKLPFRLEAEKGKGHE
ncbi:MAG TPA: phosphosulfolactate synthase [Solirubrobacterales bacterium]|nr:phosphosulfolactate synthase [Solirubrobacterales bacterium]